MAEPIVPLYKAWNAEEGHWQWGLSPEDYQRIQSGYGCGFCLEPFDFYVPVCYVCGEPNEVAAPTPVPSEWRKQGE